MRRKYKKRSPEALMDFDLRVRSRLRRDPATYVFEEVAISQIELPKAWNKFRLVDNLKKIKASRKMPPVFLYFDEKSLLFKIEDGIHRTNVAKQLGYTHVPAIVAYLRRLKR